ncbi:heat shock protein 23 [Stomoxys calcitrans]|uniref:SHSP domain-containing protein n=1 Tax=Stomoxys calcitrans TaxID=35570 RepID=A0A1I8PBQ3_STOCA|nr:heat shock protein 23 [Stomoxys calcitrans]
MSGLSILLSLIDELEHEIPSYCGNDFGLGLSPCIIHGQAHHEPIANNVGFGSLPLSLLSRLSDRHAARRGERIEGPMSTVGKDGFQVCMDVAQFKPSELNVKVINNSIIIEGKHEEREDQHGFIQRHFVRRYILPKGYDAEKVASTLSSDGVLTVSVPKPQIEENPNERVIHIQQTGPAHLNVKHNTKENKADSNGTEEEK